MRRLILVAVGIFALVSSAEAATIFIDDAAGFATAVSSSPTFEIDFESGALPTYTRIRPRISR